MEKGKRPPTPGCAFTDEPQLDSMFEQSSLHGGARHHWNMLSCQGWRNSRVETSHLDKGILARVLNLGIEVRFGELDRAGVGAGDQQRCESKRGAHVGRRALSRYNKATAGRFLHFLLYILHQHRCTGRHHWFRFRIGRIN